VRELLFISLDQPPWRKKLLGKQFRIV